MMAKSWWAWLALLGLVMSAGFVQAQDVPEAPKPDCSKPAPLKLHPGGIEGQYLVIYEKTVVDPEKRTNELVAKYEFVTRYRWSRSVRGFSAELSEKIVQALRCESGISFIEQNDRGTTAR